MKKRINQWDRLQALIRCPDYIKEFNKLGTLKDQDDLQKLFKNNFLQKQKDFLKKWDLMYSVDPKEWINKPNPELGVRFFRDDPPVKPLPYKKDADTLKYLKDDIYLTLQINMTYGLDDILEDTKQTIKEFRENVNRERGYNISNTELNPWDIYDKLENGKITKSELARQLSGEKDIGINSKLVKAKYNQIDRAYKKVCAMIKDICNDT